MNLLLTAGPADKDSLVVIQLCYLGPRERGQEFMLAISSWDGEKCLLNEVDEKSFTVEGALHLYTPCVSVQKMI